MYEWIDIFICSYKIMIKYPSWKIHLSLDDMIEYPYLFLWIKSRNERHGQGLTKFDVCHSGVGKRLAHDLCLLVNIYSVSGLWHWRQG